MNRWCGWTHFQTILPTKLPTYPKTTPIASFGNFGPIWLKIGGKVLIIEQISHGPTHEPTHGPTDEHTLL